MAGQLRLWVGIVSFVIIVTAVTFTATAQGPSNVMPEGLQRMTYEVYAGGINAVTANMDISYKNQDRYSFRFDARTKGFLGNVAPWEGSFETSGWSLKEGNDQPEIHKSVSVWRDEEEVKTYNYSQKGAFEGLSITDTGHDEQQQNIDDELTQGTIDALTATLAIMRQVADGGKCEGTSEVFDGKRRFELVFTHSDYEELKATRYNVYEGKAARCTVEVKPVAGAWHKKPRGWMSIQEQGRQKGGLPTVWLASMKPGAPAVPIKVQVKTSFGTLFMHLIEYKSGDKVQIAQKH